MAVNTSDSKAPVKLVKRMQFGILGPDEIRYEHIKSNKIMNCCAIMYLTILRILNFDIITMGIVGECQ
jgi:hypothetical protein